MSEHMSPIPSRLYNAAVGGHVCGPEDVDFGQKVVHLIKYDRAGNEVSFESQVTQANKIYVIHDDFVLSSNVTIPANCVLEFDGGSISGEYYLIGTKTKVKGYSNSGSAIWGGEFIDYYTNRHISNYYKKVQNKNFRMSAALCGFPDNVDPNSMMKFQQRVGNDYYHVCYNIDATVESDIPTSLIWKPKASSVYDSTTGVQNLANKLCSVIDNTKLGNFDGIKLHTENTTIDSVLNSGNTDAISAFLDLYSQDIITFLGILGFDRCSKIERFFVFNEEPSLIKTICSTSTLKTKLENLISSIKQRCPNACVLISCCGDEIFQEGYFDIVDYHSQNFYLSGISFLGNDVASDTGFEIAVESNEDKLNMYLYNANYFGISETGCSNKEISLVDASYWRQDTTNSFDELFEGYYYYCKVLVKLLNNYLDRLKFIQLWFIEAYYIDNYGNIRRYYDNNIVESRYFNLVFNILSNYLYE